MIAALPRTASPPMRSRRFIAVTPATGLSERRRRQPPFPVLFSRLAIAPLVHRTPYQKGSARLVERARAVGGPGGASGVRLSRPRAGAGRGVCGSVTAPTMQRGPAECAALGDMPVPNSTELHHTQANIYQAAAQEIRTLRSPVCGGVRSHNLLLISRLKVRFLHGSPLDRGAATPPDSFFPGISR